MKKNFNPNDIIGKKFNKLTVIALDHYNRKYYYKCKCDCGRDTIVARSGLLFGGTKSCGCLGNKILDINDIVGKKFNKLTVLALDHYDNNNHAYYYKCKCDCGNEIIAVKYDIVKGRIKSCGCIHRIQDPRDIVGKRFGKLVVIDLDHYDSKRHVNFYKCQCDCGNIAISSRYNLLKGISTTCGCSRTLDDINDIVGNTYNYLTVISFDHRKNDSGLYYKCKCKCGKEVVVYRQALLSGNTQSCGCKHKEDMSIMASTHRMSNTKFYKIYRGMLTRCTNPNTPSYENYGARNIKICDRWLESFENFKEDMYKSYLEHVSIYGEKNTTIDRIDVNKDYCLENCRWATIKEQNNNRRNTYYVLYNNEKLTISQLIDKYGDPRITREIAYGRIASGWDILSAITILPKQYNGKPIICPIKFNDDRKE